MSNPHYPRGIVARLLDSEHVSPITRERISARQQRAREDQNYAPQFFSTEEFALLQAVCARFLPQDEAATPTPLAADIDRRLHGNMANGWRYDAMPPDGDAYKIGLQALNESARERFNTGFRELSLENQDALLSKAQNGELSGGSWARVPSSRWFEELLAETVEIFYATPDAQNEIGYVGFADVPGWSRIGLNEHETREPEAEN